MYYPILVVAGELYDVTNAGVGLDLKAVDHVHYIQSEIVSGEQKQTHIDVVGEEGLERLLSAIRIEVDETLKRARQGRGELGRTIELMAKRAAESPADVQSILRHPIL
jgi:hypothetical protein